MAARLIRLALIWTCAVAAPAEAQRAGTIEVGAFARYTDLDKGLGMGTTVVLGGRATVYVGQTLAVGRRPCSLRYPSRNRLTDTVVS